MGGNASVVSQGWHIDVIPATAVHLQNLSLDAAKRQIADAMLVRHFFGFLWDLLKDANYSPSWCELTFEVFERKILGLRRDGSFDLLPSTGEGNKSSPLRLQNVPH